MSGIKWWGFVIAAGMLLMGCGENEEVSYKERIQRERFEKDKTFRYSDQSPIKEKEQDFFHSLSYFPVDSSYRLKATVQKFDDPSTVSMAYSDGSASQFEKYAKLSFELDSERHELLAYKRLNTGSAKDQPKSLFLPFYDSTNGHSTYDGGRYLDLDMPTENEVVIDFNKAYNPYCAYNENYACPIPPEQNRLSVPVKAGEKQYEG